MRKNKQMVSLVLAAAMAASLAGCSSGKPAETKSDSGAATTVAAESSSSAGESTTITYVTLGDTGMELLKQAAEEFKAETGIEVKLESWAYSDAYQKILTLAEGNNMPDAMYGFSSWTQQFKEAGYTVAIDKLISEDLYNDFSEAALDVCKVGDELWAMPSYMSIR